MNIDKKCKMPCSFCKNHGHTIRNCNSSEIDIIYNRIKSYASYAMGGRNYRYDENRFLQNLETVRMRDLKIACIHWKRRCDPEILSDNYVPEIASNLTYTTYKTIAIWLFLYVNHSFNELFLQHSMYASNRLEGYRIMQKRKYWRNIGLFNMNEDNASALYIQAMDEYRVNRSSQPIQQHTLFPPHSPTVPPQPRKFDMDIHLCPIPDASADATADATTDTSNDECPICYDQVNPINKIQNQCGHSICVGCFEQYMDTMIPKTTNPCCSICRSIYKKIDVYSQSTVNTIIKYVATHA